MLSEGSLPQPQASGQMKVSWHLELESKKGSRVNPPSGFRQQRKGERRQRAGAQPAAIICPSLYSHRRDKSVPVTKLYLVTRGRSLRFFPLETRIWVARCTRELRVTDSSTHRGTKASLQAQAVGAVAKAILG